MEDADRIGNVSAFFSDELEKYGLKKQKKIKIAEAEEQGWWADVARWPSDEARSSNGRPAVLIFFDRNLRGSTKRAFWFGFFSIHKHVIVNLANEASATLGAYVRVGPGDVIKQERAKDKHVLEDDEDEHYFGKYYAEETAWSDQKLALVAAASIFEIVNAVDPTVAERKDIADLKLDGTICDTERRALILARRGQGKFRADLVERWKRCAVSGSTTTAILRASHIKPWRDSDNRERLDPENGLLLNANIDALFDRGLVTFSDDGQIQMSPLLGDEERDRLGLKASMSLGERPSAQQMMYLREHRSNVFRVSDR